MLASTVWEAQLPRYKLGRRRSAKDGVSFEHGDDSGDVEGKVVTEVSR